MVPSHQLSGANDQTHSWGRYLCECRHRTHKIMYLYRHFALSHLLVNEIQLVEFKSDRITLWRSQLRFVVKATETNVC